MEIIYMIMAMLAGLCLAIQGGVNSQLNLVWAQNPILATAISFTTGTMALIFLLVILKIPIPRQLKGTGIKWWHWTGGFLGAYLVSAITFLAPMLGAGVLVALILAGQLSTAIILDHFGLIGFDRKPINWQKILGAAFLSSGVILIRFF